VNKKRIIKTGEQFLMMSGLQVIFSTYFKSASVPSFFLIWLLILTWEGNTETALVLAFFTGLIYDVVSRGNPGVTSIRFLILVYANSFLKVRNLPAMFAGAIFSSLLFFVLLLFEPAQGFLWNTGPLIKYSLLFAFYNGAITFFIALAMRKSRWKPKSGFLSTS